MDERWSLEHGMQVRRCGAGPDVVWIHGLGEWSVTFDPITHALPGFTHVLPDLPGYGRSPRTDAPTTLEQLAAHLADWLAPRPPAILVGHSLGGVVATFIAERIPCAAIINVDGNISRGDCTYSATAATYSLDDFIAGAFAAMRAEIYAAGATDPALRGYHAALLAASPTIFYRHSLDLLALSESNTLAPRLAALRCPKLFIAAVPGGVCEHTRSLLDQHHIRWTAIDRSGHWPFIDQPSAFASAVTTFLGSL